MARAKREDWKCLPMPEKHATFQLERKFSPGQFELICDGFVPKDMDDRWFIFFEDNSLYFHRSWTGNCIFTVHFAERDGTYSVTSAEVSRDPEQYKSTDIQEDTRLLNSLIDNFLIHQ